VAHATMATTLPVIFVTLLAAFPAALFAQDAGFHNAPASAKSQRNPATDPTSIEKGRAAFAANCSACHGVRGEGQAYIPAVAIGAAQQASDGELFWYITQGDIRNGMPAWSQLAEAQRWQIVGFLKSGQLMKGVKPDAPVPPAANGAIAEPPPPAPFTDFRFEAPGKVRKIAVADLPPPYATSSAGNGPRMVARPDGVVPKALPGFKVDLFAAGLENPRLMRTAPNGDVFVAETRAGRIHVLRGIGADGKAQQSEVFATGLHQPFGIAFYPSGKDPQWLYIGLTDAVVRFPYRSGDLRARGTPERLASLPDGGGHTTRDIRFSLDDKRMFVSVGSHSNVDDGDSELNRANVLVYNPDGTGMKVFASGIRNPVGLAVEPKTGELWCSTNERDGLGDNLVPDYITHVQEGGFYGWPWWYIGPHQDPRHAGKHAELRDKVIVPDVLLQPHNASLQMTFYDGDQFPAEYRGDIFAAEHGSWNRRVRTGYEVIRVPLHQTGRASGEYEDFLTGFVLDNGDVWGRPVGVTVAADGSLLVSDDGSNSIWRVSYAKP
jgi:glucose/arabinose dehydrogenase